MNILQNPLYITPILSGQNRSEVGSLLLTVGNPTVVISQYQSTNTERRSKRPINRESPLSTTLALSDQNGSEVCSPLSKISRQDREDSIQVANSKSNDNISDRPQFQSTTDTTSFSQIHKFESHKTNFDLYKEQLLSYTNYLDESALNAYIDHDVLTKILQKYLSNTRESELADKTQGALIKFI
ncbi:20819_t:CDS:2 [Racocetra persica]|uniref:20819_t:CDS:1 n=1 Tax=Racocetra persica TaxID=160502 RepID=A0ACA9KTF7_9GLOM|nr:20819_t:CDS:2 [Racocetra persica]